MRGIRLARLGLASLLLTASTAHAQSDISGTWQVTIESPQGSATTDATFMQVGESVDGTITTPIGAVDFTGALINNALSMSSKLDLAGSKLALKAKVSGDTMAGNLALGPLGEVPWSAKRKPSAAAGATTAAGAAAGAAPQAAAGTDVSGTWNITMAMGAGTTFTTVATLKQAGETITGTLGGQAGEEPVTGTMVGNVLTLRFRAATATGDAAVIMKGELGAEGLKGTVNIPGVGDVAWTGQRSK